MLVMMMVMIMKDGSDSVGNQLCGCSCLSCVRVCVFEAARHTNLLIDCSIDTCRFQTWYLCR